MCIRDRTHVDSVLHLVDIVDQTGDQRIGSNGIQLRKGQSLDVVKDRLARSEEHTSELQSQR